MASRRLNMCGCVELKASGLAKRLFLCMILCFFTQSLLSFLPYIPQKNKNKCAAGLSQVEIASSIYFVTAKELQLRSLPSSFRNLVSDLCPLISGIWKLASGIWKLASGL